MSHRHPDEARPAIPDDNAPLPPAHRPTRWTVRRGRAIAFFLLGLALAASLAALYLTYESAQHSAAQARSSSAQAAAVNRRLSVLEADLNERTRQRDAERDAAAAQAQADREQFRARFCEVLGELEVQFPKLDPLRRALNCSTATPAAAPAGAASPPARASPGPPSAPSTATPTPSPPPSAAPSSAPAVPSPPANRGLLCGLLPLC